MYIPNIPTDNLYKFIALSGVTMSLLTYFFINNNIYEIENNIIILESERIELNYEKKVLIEKIEILKHKVSDLKEEVEDKHIRGNGFITDMTTEELKIFAKNKESREYLIFLYDYMDKIFPVYTTLEQLEKHREELNRLKNETFLKELKLNRKIEIIEEKNSKLQYTFWGNWFIIVAGVIIAYFGFSLWYKKVQKPMDNEMNNKVK